MVKPDWWKTDLENIHFFEIDATNAAAPGTADEINLSEGNRTAHFKAAISEEVVIHIDPDTGEEDNSKGAKSSSRVSPFTFAAVVAQQPDKKAHTYVIPSEQHPDTETLKDPNAEFLVGYSRKSYADQYDFESNVVDLYFDRVAALGRLAITGFVGSGEKVKSVKITATGGMTGKATYPGDFKLGDKNTVNFTKVDEPLVLDYGNGVAAPAEGAFYAYFVTVPSGEEPTIITSIEVLTDQYRYTKTVEGGASFTFSDEQLLNIDFALSGAIAEAVTADNKTWYKASVLEDGYDYIIVSNGKAMSTDGSTLDAATIPTPAYGEIEFQTTPGTEIIWTADYEPAEYATGKKAGDYKLQNGNVYLQRKNQSYDLTVGGAPNNRKYYVFDYDGEHLWHLTTGQNDEEVKYYFHYNNTSWTSESAVHVTELYNSRLPIEVSFASAEAKYDLDEEKWTVAIPELTAPEGATITYSSSNEDVATFAEDGTVTPKAVGTTVITAIVAGDAEYQGGAASYTLTVTEGSVVFFVKVTDLSELNTSDTFIITNTDDNNAFKGVLNGSSILAGAGNTKAFTLTSDGKIVDDGTFEACKFTLEEKGTKYNMYFSGVERYIYPSGGSGLSNKVISESPNADQAIAFSVYEGNWTLNRTYTSNGNSSSHYFVYNTPSSEDPYFQTSSTSGTLHLFKLEGSGGTTPPTPEKQERNLSFGTESFSCTLGQSATFPPLSGKTEGVTYSSSDESVATVNASGVVSVIAAGTTIIKAEADEDDNYLAGSAQYTLTVKTASTTTTTFYRATKLEAGKNYLVVSSNMALTNNGESIAGTEVTVSNDAITLNDDVASTMLWTASTLGDGFTLSNGNNVYLQRGTGNGAAPSIGTPPETARYYTWVYSKSNKYLSTVKEGSYSAYYIYFDNNAWAQSSTANTSHTVTLYTTEPNVDPTLTFVKVNSASGLITGKKYVLVYEDATKVFNPILVSSSSTYGGTTYSFSAATENALNVTISNGSITSSDLEDCMMTLEEGYYLYVASASRYLYPTNSGIGAEASKGSSHNFAISITNGVATISRTSNNKTYNLRYSPTDGYFLSSTSDANVSLYRLDDGTTPGGGDDPGDDPGDDLTPTTPSYTKVTSITSGATYLIVSADAGNYNGADGTKAFTGDQNGTAATVNNAAGVITGDYTAYEFVISASGSDYTLLGPKGYVTGNANSGSRYIQVSSTAGTMSLSMASDFTSTDGQVDDAFYFYYTKTSGTSTSKEVLYFNTDGAFKVGGTGRKYGVYLYKKVENP